MKTMRLILITLAAVLAFGLYKAYQAAMGGREKPGVLVCRAFRYGEKTFATLAKMVLSRFRLVNFPPCRAFPLLV